MTTPRQPAACVSPEVLALMAAGQLPADEREAAEAHVATCADCYDVLMDLAMAADESAAEVPAETTAESIGEPAGQHPPQPVTPNVVVPMPVRRAAPVNRARSIIVWTSIAAGLIAVAVMAPRWLDTPERRVNTAVSTLARSIGESRPTMGRLSGGFKWGSAPPITRGTAANELPLTVQDAVLGIKKLVAADRNARTLSAAGVAYLVSGDLDASAAALDEAVVLDPKNASAWADLSAVRFERWRRSQAPVDATATLDAAVQSLLLTPTDPVARFNHALAVESLGLTKAAIDSWNAYLALDSRSPWADEARTHLRQLTGRTPAPQPAPTPAAFTEAAVGRLSAAQRSCLDLGRRHLADARAAFDASRTAQSRELAVAARADFLCAGVPTFDADAQAVWSDYFLGTPATGDALTLLASRAAAAGFARAAAQINYVRGRTEENAGRLADADAFFDSAMAAFEAAGDHEMAASTSVQMSEVSAARGDMRETWQRLSKAIASIPLMAPRRQHLTLATSSLMATRAGFGGAAQFFANELIATDQRNSNDPALLVGAYLQHASAAYRAGNVDGALASLAQARATHPQIAEAAFRTQFGAELDELTGTILVERDPGQAVVALTSAMQVFAQTNRSLRRARLLLLRGRAYRVSGQAAAAEHDWAEGADVFEDQRPEIRNAQQRIDHLDQLWDLFRELMVARASSPLRALEVAERFRARALLDALSADRQLAPLSGDALFAWLPQDVTAVAYAVLPDQLFRWTITRDGVTLDREQVTARALATMVDGFRQSVGAGRLASAEASALARVLLPASLSTASGRRLVVLPDGALFGVPFAALPLGVADALVVDRLTVSVAPSLSVLRASRANVLSLRRALLVSAGAANPAEHLAALPGARAEIAELTRLYAGATVLDGTGASRDAVLRSLSMADVVHFAGHAVADSTMPSQSRLFVSPGASQSASISFDDLRRTRLRQGAVVVLSACDAARGKVFRSEGAVGLTYPFLANGAAAVVAALWQIDDATPPAIWREFHEGIRAGVSPDAALAASQRVSRQAGVSPAIWAAFESVGGMNRHE